MCLRVISAPPAVLPAVQEIRDRPGCCKLAEPNTGSMTACSRPAPSKRRSLTGWKPAANHPVGGPDSSEGFLGEAGGRLGTLTVVTELRCLWRKLWLNQKLPIITHQCFICIYISIHLACLQYIFIFIRSGISLKKANELATSLNLS